MIIAAGQAILNPSLGAKGSAMRYLCGLAIV